MAAPPPTTITLADNKASIVLGDLLSVVQDSNAADAFENVDISFTCKKCKTKKNNLKELVEHLSAGGCQETSTPGPTPRRRGRPPKVKTAPDWSNQAIDKEYIPPAQNQAVDTEDTPEEPESRGRKTRMRSGALKRKSALELLGMTSGKEQFSDDDFDVEDDDEDDRPKYKPPVRQVIEDTGAPKVKRGRGRPRKYPRKEDLEDQTSQIGAGSSNDAQVNPEESGTTPKRQKLDPETGAVDDPVEQMDSQMNEDLGADSDVIDSILNENAINVKEEIYPGNQTLVIKLVSPEKKEALAGDSSIKSELNKEWQDGMNCQVDEINEDGGPKNVEQEAIQEDPGNQSNTTESQPTAADQIPQPVVVLMPKKVGRPRGRRRRFIGNTYYRPRFGAVHGRKFKCKKCHHRAFPTKEELDVHEGCHFNEDPNAADYYKCKACDYTQKNWNRMLSHLINHEEFKKVFENSDVLANILGKFSCPDCVKEFDRKANLIQHIRFVHNKKTRHCTICNKDLGAMDEKTYIRHVDKCRNIDLVCDKCDYTTKVRANMKLHQRIHEGQGLICQICNASFPTKQRYKNHCLTHTDDRPRYMCDTCGADFVSIDAVKKHSFRFHTGITSREWKCNLCSYQGKLEYDLKKHIQQVHNKKYKCKDCGFATNIESSYNQHLEYHAPDRVCPCPYSDCYYRGCSAKQLANHVSQAHNIHYKNQCPICLKHFKKKTTLLRHLITHTGDRPYFCAECGENFYSHSTYYRHRHKTGHDAKREGIVSVPQNITIQYLEEVQSDPTLEPSALGEIDSLIEQANQEAQRAEQVRLGNLVQVKTDPVHPATLNPSLKDDGTLEWKEQEISTEEVPNDARGATTLASILAQPPVIDSSGASYGQKIIEVPIVNSAGVQQNVNVVTEIDGTEITIPDIQHQTQHQFVIQPDAVQAMVADDHTITEATTIQAGTENLDEVTFVVQVHDDTGTLGTDKEEVVMTEEETAKIIEHLSAAGTQPVVYQDYQTLVEVEPSGDGVEPEQQYAVVMLPPGSGDEPEAALSMLQLQSGGPVNP